MSCPMEHLHAGASGKPYATPGHPTGQDREASYQEVHHVGLVVPQGLDSMEDIHSSLVSEHLTDNADGTERATTAPSVPVGEESRRLGSVFW